MARRTLSKARFLLAQASHSERHSKAYEYECYVEAAVIFARNALSHLRYEYGRGDRRKGVKGWIDSRERSPSIKKLIEDVFFYDEPSPQVTEAHKKLKSQLDEIEDIINECEMKFKR